MSSPPASSADRPIIGVVVVDDHRMVAESFAGLLATDPAIEVLGLAGNGLEGLGLVGETRPDVALVDHQMPGQNGLQLAAEIRRRFPDTRVVMVTGTNDEALLVEAIEAGCTGFLTKDRAISEVIGAVHAAAVGEAIISPALLARLLPKLHPIPRQEETALTARECQLLLLVAEGRTNKAIAEQLFLSVNTIRNYIQTILTKLDAHSKLEAVSIAVREGLIDYPSAADRSELAERYTG